MCRMEENQRQVKVFPLIYAVLLHDYSHIILYMPAMNSLLAGLYVPSPCVSHAYMAILLRPLKSPPCKCDGRDKVIPENKMVYYG